MSILVAIRDELHRQNAISAVQLLTLKTSSMTADMQLGSVLSITGHSYVRLAMEAQS